MWLSALLLGLLSSFGYDYALLARPRHGWQRPSAALCLHCGTWLLSVGLVLLLCQRVWFAVVLLSAGQLLLLLVHHAKHASLKEVFIFQDFDYFTDAIKHPRLYLPFFGISRAILATLAFIAAIALGMWLETPLPTAHLFMSGAALLLAGYGLIKWGLKTPPALTYNPEEDLRALGQLAFFWYYWQAQATPRPDLHSQDLSQAAANAPANAPHIIAVQSESFFDARQLSPNIHPKVLAEFDLTQKNALQYGSLDVPAWGANTVRTEAAFLTGLSPEQLGVHRFNPYRLFTKQTVLNLAAIFKQRGYRTVCIHPYPASFYDRASVFPRLGFDEFIDVQAFVKTNAADIFVSDKAVADKVQALLAAQDPTQALFIFVITMENHGPLHLERPAPQDNARFYQNPPPASWQDLTVYLKHLANADAMLAQLKTTLSAADRAGLLCWYGDHVPIMADVYATLGEPSGQSQYLLWHSQTNAPQENCQPLAAHQLGSVLLAHCNQN